MSYDDYLKAVKEYAEDNASVISEVNKADKEPIFPQHILWAKTVSEHLENDEAKTLRIDEEFYFTEKLVNKLMLFAFLKGRNDVDEKSYKKGWDDCMDDIAEKLGWKERFMENKEKNQEQESSFINYYECSECGETWEDVWSCMCNDRCPNCNSEIEPYESRETKEDD